MAVEISEAYLALGMFGLAVGGVQWAAFRAINQAGERQGPVIDATRKELLSQIEKVQAVCEKSIHDKAGESMRTIGKIELEMRQLERQAVTKEDMKAGEERMTLTLERMLTKLDAITDRVGELSAERRLGDNR